MKQYIFPFCSPSFLIKFLIEGLLENDIQFNSFIDENKSRVIEISNDDFVIINNLLENHPYKDMMKVVSKT